MNDVLPTIATIMGILAQSGYYVQARKILVDKSSENVSIALFCLYVPLMILWIWYGVLISNIPVLISNIIGIIGCVLTIILYIKYRKVEK